MNVERGAPLDETAFTRDKCPRFAGAFAFGSDLIEKRKALKAVEQSLAADAVAESGMPDGA